MSVHCNPAGSIPAGDVRFRFTEIVVPGDVVPEATDNDWLNPASQAHNKIKRQSTHWMVRRERAESAKRPFRVAAVFSEEFAIKINLKRDLN